MPTTGASPPRSAPTRRILLGAGGAALAAPFVLRGRAARAAARPIKIGLVVPQTGPLAAFSEADGFVLAQVKASIGDGMMVAGASHPVQIIVKDSQSSTSRAAEVAGDLITGDKVDLLLAASTPDTVNPVADQAEVNGVPCITSDCPWQPYFFGRRGDPAKGFRYTYHFFWGLEDVIGVFLGMWQGAATNKVVGGLFPNDADGNAWGDPKLGFAPALTAAGFKLVDTGRYQPLNSDFSSQISAFKAAGVEIVTGVMIPPDFATFWSQAGQQGFRPKVVSIGKALLFPSAIAALGERGVGLSSEVWWTSHHPFSSSLTGQTAAALCAAYTASTGRPWTQPLGFRHALFEVALDVLRRTGNVEDPDSIVTAIEATDCHSVVGRIHWTGQPVKNVCRTPLVGGQWHKDGGALALDVVNNVTAPEIPLTGKLELLG